LNKNKINWKGYDRDIFIYMFRYCLTRRSYAVATAIELIQTNWSVLSVPDRKLIQKEIKEHFELYSNIDGFDMDKKYWNVILDLPIEDKGEI
jgi:hypothetical protein